MSSVAVHVTPAGQPPPVASGPCEQQPGSVSVAPVSVNDPVQAVAESLGLALSSDEDAKTQLLTYLTNKRQLLVFDNFEHVMDGASHRDRGPAGRDCGQGVGHLALQAQRHGRDRHHVGRPRRDLGLAG